MKKSGILNKDISELIASMGHFDQLTICDAGLPIPADVWRIDLAVEKSLPGFIDVVRAVTNDLEVQQIILAEEISTANPENEKQIRGIFPDTDILYIPHEDFERANRIITGDH